MNVIKRYKESLTLLSLSEILYFRFLGTMPQMGFLVLFTGIFLIYAGTAHGLDAIDSCLNLLQVAPLTNTSGMLAQDEARVISLNSRLRPNIVVQPLSATISVKPGLSIGSGNYYVKIGLGTPTKYYAMLLDTGSSFSWLQCLPCEYCHPQSDPLFNPSASKSYKTISCSSPACADVRDATLNDPACDFSSSHCIYTASYGDRSFSVRVLSQDVLSLSPSSSITGFLYGCGNDNMGLFGKAAGLLGLGRHRLSLTSQMSSKHGSTFSYCLPSYTFSFTPHRGSGGGGGFLSVGKTAAADGNFKYTPMIRNSLEPSLYFLKLISITIAGQSLGVTAAEYRVPTIIDSGTVISRLPISIYNNLKQSFIKIMTSQFKYKQAPAFSILDTCFITSSNAVQKAPLVQMFFAGGAALSLEPHSALIQVTDDTTCLAFASSGTTGGLVIIGNHQQQTFEVVYDVSMSRIGISPHGCN